jgi:hypothetical protein
VTNVSRTNRNGKRPKSNFYPTPAGCTRALIAHERAAFVRRSIWEPAAGDGAIGEVFREVGYRVAMTEKRIVAHPDIKGGRDFLNENRLLGDIIVTNPPYGKMICDDFIRHALQLGPHVAAFFLPLTYLASIGRADLIEGVVGGLSLQRVLVFRERITLAPKGLKLTHKGVVSFAWFIWEMIDHDGTQPPCTIHRISAITNLANHAPRGGQ